MRAGVARRPLWDRWWNSFNLSCKLPTSLIMRILNLIQTKEKSRPAYSPKANVSHITHMIVERVLILIWTFKKGLILKISWKNSLNRPQNDVVFSALGGKVLLEPCRDDSWLRADQRILNFFCFLLTVYKLKWKYLHRLILSDTFLLSNRKKGKTGRWKISL